MCDKKKTRPIETMPLRIKGPYIHAGDLSKFMFELEDQAKRYIQEKPSSGGEVDYKKIYHNLINSLVNQTKK